MLLLGGHFYAEIRFPHSWQYAIEHLWTTWPSREPFSPVLGLLRGSLPAWVYICLRQSHPAIHMRLCGKRPTLLLAGQSQTSSLAPPQSNILCLT